LFSITDERSINLLIVILPNFKVCRGFSEYLAIPSNGRIRQILLFPALPSVVALKVLRNADKSQQLSGQGQATSKKSRMR
jgi:hypothetical protein